MTRRTLLALAILLVIFGAFIAEGLVKQEVCISGQITDQVSTTFLEEICE